MALQVIGGDPVGDTAVAQHRDQPIKQRGRIVLADGRSDAFCSEGGARLGNEIGDAGQPTDLPDQAHGVIETLIPRREAGRPDRRDRVVVLRHL